MDTKWTKEESCLEKFIVPAFPSHSLCSSLPGDPSDFCPGDRTGGSGRTAQRYRRKSLSEPRIISGKLKIKPGLILTLPNKTVIIKGHVDFESFGYHYSVDYSNEGNGVLRYTYEKQKTPERVRAESLVANVCVTVVIAIFLLTLMPTGMPVLAPVG